MTNAQRDMVHFATSMLTRVVAALDTLANAMVESQEGQTSLESATVREACSDCDIAKAKLKTLGDGR